MKLFDETIYRVAYSSYLQLDVKRIYERLDPTYTDPVARHTVM